MSTCIVGSEEDSKLHIMDGQRLPGNASRSVSTHDQKAKETT